MDITHCLQQPAQKSHDGIVKSGGERYLIPTMGKMAMALDVHGVFLETHDRPDESMCDAPTQWPLDRLPWLLSHIGCPLKQPMTEIGTVGEPDFLSKHEGEDVAMYSDTMDDMGFSGRIVSKLKWNKEDVRFCGRARTVMLEEGDFDDGNVRAGLSFVESLGPGDVLIVQGSKKYAYFGELMSRLSMRAGVTGVIVDGATRDTAWTTTYECTIPVGSFSVTPVDIRGRGRMKEVDVPIDISTGDNTEVSENMMVHPGDFVFADRDGVAIVPKGIEESVKQAVRKMVRTEVDIKQRIGNNEEISKILDLHGDF
jgi:regulator of RNase E activity RraA